MKPSVLFLCMGLAVGACSQGEDPSSLFDGGSAGGTLDPSVADLAALGDGSIPVSSPQFFSEVIGDRVLFEVDQSALTPQATRTLDLQARWLLQYPSLPVLIEGHADEQGTREYNIALSARRASAVRNYLVTKGIPDRRLSTVPFGKERPVAVCSDESCWSQNRRAVTVVTGAPAA